MTAAGGSSVMRYEDRGQQNVMEVERFVRLRTIA